MAITINGTTGIETNTDTGKLKVGASDDLQIYHDGSYSKLKTGGSSHLFIQADYDANQWLYLDAGHSIELRTTGYETAVKCNSNGSVDLYYDNAKKFETTSTGVQVTGNIDIDGNIDIADGSKIKFGTGDDAEMYDDGSDLKTNTSHNWTVQANGSSFAQFALDLVFWTKHHTPWANDSYDLGSSSYKWDDVYATNGTIQTSDKNEKNTIIDSDLGLSFVNKLKPVSYKFNSKTRTHYGLIAQDVETTLSDISKPTTGFAGFIKTDIPDQIYDAIKDEGNIPEGKKAGDVKIPAHTSYGLRYGEFISPLIKAVQELSAEVETLKTKVAALEAHTHE